MSTVSNRCSLCFKKSDNLTNLDSLQLCDDCYKKYTESAYNQRVALINAIKCYRMLISKYENNGNIKIDCNFENIFGVNKK